MSDETVIDLWRRADEDYDSGRFDECIERMRLLLQHDPGNSDAHGYLADVLRHFGNWEAAIDEYREALRINPVNARWRAGLAEALSEKGEGEQAIIECLEALRLDPNIWNVHFVLAGALHRLNMWNAALFECRESLRVDPTHRGDRLVRLAICGTLFERAFQSRGRYKWRILQHVFAVFPMHRRTSEARGDWLAACSALEDYENSYPGNPESLTLLGRAQWALDEREAAVGNLWRAIEADPSDPLPYSHLSKYLLILGRWKSFARLIQRAWDSLNTDPRYRRMQRMERLIDRTSSEQ